MTIVASPGPSQRDGDGETEIVEPGPISLSAVLVKGGTFNMGDL